MKKITTPVLLLLILCAVFFLYFPGLSKYLKLRHHDERLGHEIEDLEKKIADLKKEEYLIKNDPAHLEQVMRKELGLVKPGEVVYKLVPEEAKTVNSSGASQTPPSTLPANQKNNQLGASANS